MNIRLVSLLTGAIIVLALVAGCTAENAGDRGDKLVTNTCKSPLSCIELADTKVCASGCNAKFGDKCPAGMACREVTFSGTGSSMGGYCLPTK